MKRCLLLALLISWSAYATIDAYEFDDYDEEQRFRVLIDELRCPKCQNQNIADSNAGLAKDIKDRAYRLINEGKSNGLYGQSAKVTIYTMDNLSYNGVKLDKIKNMMISENSGIPITETNQFDLGIGYQFLKNYRSIWNFRTKKIILLSR